MNPIQPKSNFMPREPGSPQQYQCKKCGEVFMGIIPTLDVGLRIFRFFKKNKNVCPKCGSGLVFPFPAMRW